MKQTTSFSKDHSDDFGSATHPKKKQSTESAHQHLLDGKQQSDKQKEELLIEYNQKRLKYDKSGVSIFQSQLLKAFADQAFVKKYSSNKQFWGYINRQQYLENLIKPNEQPSTNAREIVSRLLNTAYHIKTTYSDKMTEQAINQYFHVTFPLFIGKYTEWELLDDIETYLPQINPIDLNLYFRELKSNYEKKQAENEDFKDRDYNKLVEMLGEEHKQLGLGSQREAKQKEKQRKRQAEKQLDSSLQPTSNKRANTGNSQNINSQYDQIDQHNQILQNIPDAFDQDASRNQSFVDIFSSRMFGDKILPSDRRETQTNGHDNTQMNEILHFQSYGNMMQFREMMNDAIGKSEQEYNFGGNAGFTGNHIEQQRSGDNEHDDLQKGDSIFNIRQQSGMPPLPGFEGGYGSITRMLRPDLREQERTQFFGSGKSKKNNNPTPIKKEKKSE